MPNKFIDYYDVLGTSIEVVYSKEYPNELDRNLFIKSRYELRMNNLIGKKKVADFNSDLSSIERIQRHREIDEEIVLVEEAYNALKTEPLRILYNKEILSQQEIEQIEEQEMQASMEKTTYTKQEQFRNSVKYEEEEDLYRALGITKKEVNAKPTIEHQITLIQKAYYRKIRDLQDRKLRCLPRERERIEEKIKRCNLAYQVLSSPDLKREYDGNSYDDITFKTYYDILEISMYKLQELSIEQANDYIGRKRKMLLDDCQKRLQKSRDSNEIRKIKFKLELIEEAYDKLKSPTRRRKENERIQRKKEKQDRKIKMQEIEKKYNHIEEYNPSLIDNIKPSKTMNLENKAVIRKQEPQQAEKFYMDRLNRQLRIRKTGKILYRSTLTGIDFVEEYEVIRKIKGEEKRDIIYTNLEISKLSTNPETGRIEDIDYYNCVINELLSEESIEGSKYNGGFIGEVLKDKQGNYYHTLGKEKLPTREKEMLTAILILKQREQQIGIER